MNDDQFIELIETTPAEELTPQQIELIRARMPHSPVLRGHLAHRLDMDRYLSDALAGPQEQVSADDIIARAKYAPALRESRLWTALGWGICLLLVGFVIGILSLAYLAPPPHGDAPQVASASQDQTDRSSLEAGAAQDTSKEDGAAGSANAEQPGAVKSTEASVAKPIKPANADVVKEEPAITSKPAHIVDVPPELDQGEKPEVAVAPAREPKVWDIRPRGNGIGSTFAELTNRNLPPSDEDLKQWFAPVPGHNLNTSLRDVYGLRTCVFDGLARVQAPIASEAAWRLTLFEHHKFQFHFFRGLKGVTFAFSEHGLPGWAAYRTERKAGEYKPSKHMLLSTDEERYWRTSPTPPVTFELRFADGMLTLSRGRIRLLDAPVEAAPDEVYFEGHAIIRELHSISAEDLPPIAAASDYAKLDAVEARPAPRKWKGELVRTSDFIKHDDGAVELTSEKSKERPWVAVDVDATSPSEIILQLDHFSPGTGIFLGDSQGTPRYQIGFLKDQRTGGIVMTWLAPGDQRVEHHQDANQMPQPYPAPRAWIKLIVGAGTVKCWTSEDGVRWGRPFDPNNNYQGPVETVGLFCQPGDPKRSVRLARLIVRELPALAALARPEIRTEAPALLTAGDLNGWLDAMLKSKPENLDIGEWRRACALRTLSRGAPAQLGMPLITALVEEVLADSKSPPEKLTLLHDAVLVAHLWDDTGLALKFARYYEDVGRLAYAAGEQRPYTLVATAQMSSPIWCRSPYNFTPEELLRAEIFELVHRDRMEELAELALQWRFYRRPPVGQQPQPGLVDWALAVASRRLPREAGVEQIALLNDWRHPLVAELSKEGFNVLAELEAALDGKLYREACQIITTAAANDALGLLPDSKDSRLMTSLSGAVSSMMTSHPELRQVMNEQFGPLGTLRVRQAIADEDAESLVAATLQFYGTSAASEAHLWLGDRALAGGAVGDALGHYRQARSAVEPALENRLAAAEKIAAAMAGEKVEIEITDSVEFGDTRFSPGELQSLVDDLLKRHSVSGSAGQSANSSSQVSAVKPSRFEVQQRGRFDGDAGENPQQVPGELNQFEVDWAARQLAVAVKGDRAIFSNRFQVASLDLNSGNWQWRMGLGGEQAFAHDWNVVPFRPLVTATHVYVRRLPKFGPSLACVELASGKLVWATKHESDHVMASDPFWIQGRLMAITATRVEQNYMLALATFDPATGDKVQTLPLTALRDTWWQHRNCQVAELGDRIVVAAGGSLICCDLAGQIHWVRQQPWIPAMLDRAWVAQAQQPPIVVGDRIVVLQPGVRSLVCLDAASGRVVWQHVLPDVQRVTLSGDRSIVRLRDEIISVDVRSGELKWRSPLGKLLEAELVSTEGPVLCSIAEQVAGENNWRPELVWLDRDTGKQIARSPLDTLKHERPRLGPMFVHQGKVWALFGRGEQDPHRDLVQLNPQGDAEQIKTDEPVEWTAWTKQLDPTRRAELLKRVGVSQ